MRLLNILRKGVIDVKRKVFIASKNPESVINKLEINNRFLKDRFQLAAKKNEAEFIIFDLNNPPIDKLKFWGERTPFTIHNQNIPVIFVALEGLENQDILNDIRGAYDCVPPIYKARDEVFNFFAWFESLFPFYNECNATDIANKGKNILIISKMRAETVES